MKKAEFEVQKAVYGRLNGNLVCPVYDAVPENPKYPFLEIGEAITTNGSYKGCNLQIVTVTFHTWDRWGSNANISEINSDAVERITVSNDVTPSFLTLTNFTVVNQFETGSTIIKDIDGQTRHLIQTMEIWCHQN